MKFAEFQAQVAEDLDRAMREHLPSFFRRLKEELAPNLETRGGFAALEREMAQSTDQVVYRIMSEWVLRTADRTPEICPACDHALEKVTRGVEREVVLKTGKVMVRRAVGWCRGCEKWRCPGDVALMLNEVTGHDEAGDVGLRA